MSDPCCRMRSMEIEVELEEAGRRWSELLARAADGDRVVLLVDGHPIGALVGEDDLMAVLAWRASRETGPPN